MNYTYDLLQHSFLRMNSIHNNIIGDFNYGFYQLKVILLVSGTGENNESTMEHCLNYFYIVWKPGIQ